MIPHRENVLLEGFSLFDDYLVVQHRRDALSRLRVIPWSGEGEHEVDFGEPAYAVYSTPPPPSPTRPCCGTDIAR